MLIWDIYLSIRHSHWMIFKGFISTVESKKVTLITFNLREIVIIQRCQLNFIITLTLNLDCQLKCMQVQI